jgi:hypothetical protein
MFTRACRWTRSWTKCLHLISLRSILILSCNLHLRFPNVFFPWRQTRNAACMSHLTSYMQTTNHPFILIDFIILIIYDQEFSRYSDELLARLAEFNSRQGQEFFLHATASRQALGPTQPPIQWEPRALSPGVKWQEHEAYHSPPFSGEVKNGRAIRPFPHASPWRVA